MNIRPPIPLTDPDGVLYGFVCPRCHGSCFHSTTGGSDRRLPANVKESLREAAMCCICRTCGKEIGWLDKIHGQADIYTCADCTLKAKAAQAPKPAARRSRK